MHQVQRDCSRCEEMEVFVFCIFPIYHQSQPLVMSARLVQPKTHMVSLEKGTVEAVRKWIISWQTYWNPVERKCWTSLKSQIPVTTVHYRRTVLQTNPVPPQMIPVD